MSIGSISGSATPEPSGDLTLREAMALAVVHHPRLQAFAADVRAAEARGLQAGLWSNPELEAEVEDIAGSGEFSGFAAAETTLSLAQTFPLGGDLERRRALAGAESDLANWDYEAARLEVLVEVTQGFVDALAADRRLTLVKRELELAEATAEVTMRRVEAGDASPVEQARAALPVITAEVDVAQAERLREAAYRRLAMTWGSPHATFDRLAGDLERIDPVPDSQALVQQINRIPAVARWASEISARIAQRRLAEAEATPDLTGRLGVKHHNEPGDAALVVGVSLPLPLFDRRQGDVLAARLGEAAARQRQRDAELRIQSMLDAAYTRLVNARDEAIALRERALPAANRAFEATRLAFGEGKLPFMDVLDAQRTLFELEHRYVDALVDYHTASADIESLIGQRLDELTGPSVQPPPQPGDPS